MPRLQTLKRGMAQLEEFLQNTYVEHYAKAKNFSSKPELLNDVIDGLLLKDGTRNYIINDGKVYYLINKSSLPEEIQDVLIDGNGYSDYSKYIRLQDVYGLTEDLQVYYCDEEGTNTYGEMIVADVDPNTPVNQINNNSVIKDVVTDALANIGITVNPETGITIGNVESLSNLVIDGNEYRGLTSLSGIGELKGIRTLTLSNLGSETQPLAALDGINGMPDLYYIYFKNCYITDYSNLAGCSRLEYLYMYLPPEMQETYANAQVTNLSNGLANANNLTKLENFGISGVTGYFEKTYSNLAVVNGSTESNLSIIENFTNLSKTLKSTIKYMYLDHNKISSIECLNDFTGLNTLFLACNTTLKSLHGLENHNSLSAIYGANCVFENLNGLSGSTISTFYNQGNTNLTSLSGLENCKNLYTLYLASDTNLTDISALSSKTSLFSLNLTGCTALENISVIGTLTGLKYLHLASCEKLIDSQVKQYIADSGIAAQCGGNFSIAGKYEKYFTTIRPDVNLSYDNLGYYLTGESSEFVNIKNRTNVTKLNLEGQNQLEDKDLQDTLKSMTGLKALNLSGCSRLASVSFVKNGNLKALQELDIQDVNPSLTDISDLWIADSSLVHLKISNTNMILTGMNDFFKRAYDFSRNRKTRFHYFLGKWILVEWVWTCRKKSSICHNDHGYWWKSWILVYCIW